MLPALLCVSNSLMTGGRSRQALQHPSRLQESTSVDSTEPMKASLAASQQDMSWNDPFLAIPYDFL